jgi:hypothetical protein
MKLEHEKALRARRERIRDRWLEILYVEPDNTTLGNPSTLVFLLDETLDAVFAALRRGNFTQPVSAPVCACGRNPFLSYFRAGTQALFEALVLIQAEIPKLDPAERDASFLELRNVINGVAQREIGGFGSVCEHRDRLQAKDSEICRTREA